MRLMFRWPNFFHDKFDPMAFGVHKNDFAIKIQKCFETFHQMSPNFMHS